MKTVTKCIARPFKFTFHYNKPLSRKNQSVWWTLHFKKKCHYVEDVKFFGVPEISTKTRSKQPFGVLSGTAIKITIIGTSAYVI